jgi:hypothetical protein
MPAPTRLRLSWLPRYSDAYASSRLRVFTLHRELLAQGHDSRIGFDADADVLIVQKHEPGEAMDRAAGFKGLVVYDFDDVMSDEAMRRAADVADVVTTDTIGHLAWALPRIGTVRTAIVPDPIDYYPAGSAPASTGAGAVWLGASDNYGSATWMVDPLLEAGVPVVTITDVAVDPRTTFRKWTLDTCPSDVRAAAVAILSHRGGDQGKSVNRMIAAINLGVPCIVGFSREYEALARTMGLEWSIAESEAGVVELYRRLTSEPARSAYLAAAQPYVWDQFSPAASAARLLDAIRG